MPRNDAGGTGVRGDMKAFEDHFSRRAGTYLRHRPAYPEALYSHLASLAPHRRLAWDCGTGNGQAAVGLAEYFDRVIATDASADQLALAPFHRKIEYRVARSEDAGLESSSVALVTVAVAVHWFDFDKFYAEVRRVLSPGGVIAVWCYSVPAIDPAIDGLLGWYLRDVLSGYWPDRFRYIHEQYRTLPFPFRDLTPPEFTMETVWSAEDVLGFLKSWSGTANYEKQRGESPIELIRPRLMEAWGKEKAERLLRWKLFLRVGLVE